MASTCQSLPHLLNRTKAASAVAIMHDLRSPAVLTSSIPKARASAHFSVSFMSGSRATVVV